MIQESDSVIQEKYAPEGATEKSQKVTTAGRAMERRHLPTQQLAMHPTAVGARGVQ